MLILPATSALLGGRKRKELKHLSDKLRHCLFLLLGLLFWAAHPSAFVLFPLGNESAATESEKRKGAPATSASKLGAVKPKFGS